MSAPEQFARNLRRLRKKRDLTQGELGDLAGMHRTEISMLERAGREPRLGTLIKLAAALEVPLAELFKGIEWQPPARTSSPTGRFRISSARSRK